MTLKKKIHENHNEQLNVANNGIKILQGEAIKYRKFDNYLRKEPIKPGFNKWTPYLYFITIYKIYLSYSIMEVSAAV